MTSRKKPKLQVNEPGLVPVKVPRSTLTLMVDEQTWESLSKDKHAIIPWCIEQRQNNIKLKDNNVTILRKCGKFKDWRHIDDFRVTFKKESGAKVYRFNSYCQEASNKISHDKRRAFIDSNMPLMRYFFNGSEDEQLKCLVTGLQIESRKVFNQSTNEWRTCKMVEFHHMLTIDNSSVHKIDKDLHPNKLISGKMLSNRENISWLLDLMSTISVSQDEHKCVHAFPSSDIRYWQARNALPWALKTKENFIQFGSKINLDIDYDWFMFMHTFDWYQEHKNTIEKIEWRNNPESLNRYVARFKKPQ